MMKAPLTAIITVTRHRIRRRTRKISNQPTNDRSKRNQPPPSKGSVIGNASVRKTTANLNFISMISRALSLR